MRVRMKQSTTINECVIGRTLRKRSGYGCSLQYHARGQFNTNTKRSSKQPNSDFSKEFTRKEHVTPASGRDVLCKQTHPWKKSRFLLSSDS